MLKKLDLYIIKTFFAPFLLIFSVLVFILLVNFIWIQMANLMGKGLTTLELIRFLYYYGVSVVKMALPLTILLASIMTFGNFGERYELAAMKSAKMSLLRVMQPLLILTIGFSIILYFFSNNIIPDFQRKGKNMLFNIASTRPALNFTEGQFINHIPGASVKFDKISGENGEFLEGVFVHMLAHPNQNQRTIISKKGKFTPANHADYLKLVLYDGYIFEDQIERKTTLERGKQENQLVKFDSLVSHFDISEIINRGIEQESITEYYQFQNYAELDSTLTSLRKDDKEFINSMSQSGIVEINYTLGENNAHTKTKSKEPFVLDSLKKEEKLKVLDGAYNKIQSLKISQKNRDTELFSRVKFHNKVVMYQQQIITYSFTCLIFFLIGSSLGSIIRKGGMGIPIIIAIVVFMVFYILNITMENLAWKEKINPYLASWLPNMILLPFGIWMTIKAVNDSQVFDVEKYKAALNPIIKLFVKNKEHKRYQ